MDSVDTPLRRFCAEAATLSSIQTPKEVNQFHDDVEKLLTTLDEYCNLVDLARGDTNHILSVALPQLHEKAERLNTVFKKIDALEHFLYVMKRNVDAMEAAVDAGERDLGTLTTLKKSLMSKFSSSKPVLANRPTSAPQQDGPPVFQAPQITPLEDWMPFAADAASSPPPESSGAAAKSEAGAS